MTEAHEIAINLWKLYPRRPLTLNEARRVIRLHLSQESEALIDSVAEEFRDLSEKWQESRHA